MNDEVFDNVNYEKIRLELIEKVLDTYEQRKEWKRTHPEIFASRVFSTSSRDSKCLACLPRIARTL